MDSEGEPEGPHAVALPNNHGWQRRLFCTALGCLVLVVLVALAAVLPGLAGEPTSPPHLVYPPPVQATIEAEMTAIRFDTSGERAPISQETIDRLMKIYGLKGCQVGRKYGALCQDGTFERSGLLSEDELDEVCSQNGGVKEWIVCR